MKALTNSLVHCNYAVQGNIVVIRSKEQIVFRNPRCMLMSVETFMQEAKVCAVILSYRSSLFNWASEKKQVMVQTISSKDGWIINGVSLGWEKSTVRCSNIDIPTFLDRFLKRLSDVVKKID